jgi:hypothetical protein
MSNPKKVHLEVEVTADVAALIANAAAKNNMTSSAVVGECISQQLEPGLRHRVLIQRQDDVDAAILELARLVGRLTAGPIDPQETICRYRTSGAE